MTDLEILQKCINDLGGISCPTALFEQIGIPVYNVRQNLIMLLNSVAEQTQKNRAAGEEIQIEPVSEEVSENEQPGVPEG